MEADEISCEEWDLLLTDTTVETKAKQVDTLISLCLISDERLYKP